MFGWKKKGKEGAGTESESEAPRADVKVKVKDRKNCAVLLAVEVPADQVRKATEDSFRRVQSRAKLPGFRPGKAPMEMVKKNFQDAAWEDALDRLLRESVYSAVTQENVVPITTPVVDKIDGEPTKALRFEVKVECAPTVEPKDYKGLPLQKKSRTVTDADTDKRLNDLRESNAKLVLSKDASVDKKHFVVADYDSFLDGQPVANGSAKNQLIEMAAPQNVEGFTEGLLGAKDGETREVPVRFPDLHPQKELAGKTVLFKVTVTAIKEKEMPALDDEFAKDLGVESLAALKERLRKDLETGAERALRQDLEKQVIDGLLQRNVFDVPPSQTEERARHLTAQVKDYLAQQGASEADWKSAEPKMLEKNRPEAERQVRLSYLLSRIAELEKINVEDADVDAQIQKIVDGARPEQRTDVENWMKGRRDTLRAQLREERLFDFLIQQAKVTETPAA